MKKEMSIGFLVGIIATVFGFYFFMEFVSNMDLKTMINFLFEKQLFWKFLGLASLPNLFVFFVFLKKKQDYRARGVIMETLVVALLILIAQLF